MCLIRGVGQTRRGSFARCSKRAAANMGPLLAPREELRRVIDELWNRQAISATQRDLFHQLRRTGNDAVHGIVGKQSEALHQLQVAHQLAIWFRRSFGKQSEVRSRTVRSTC